MNINKLHICYEIDSPEFIYRKGIYALQNTKNGKMYIGQAGKSFIKRWLEHQHGLYHSNHKNNHLQNSYHKYGKDSFKFMIIELMPDEINNEIEWLNVNETKWIIHYRNSTGVYNMNDGGTGVNPSKETRHLLSIKQKERYINNPELKTLTSEHFKKMYLDNPSLKEQVGFLSSERWKDPEYKNEHSLLVVERWKDPEYREHVSKAISSGLTEESRTNIGLASAERWKDPEYREHVSKAISSGLTEESRTNIGLASAERWKYPEYYEHMCNIQQERVKDPEYLKKIADGNKGKKVSDETRNKQSVSITLAYENDPIYRKRLSHKQREKMKDKSYREHIGCKESETKRHIFASYRESLDNILHDVYATNQRLKKLSMIKKLSLIMEIASELKKL